MLQTRADLLQVKKCLVDGQRAIARESRHIATREVLQNKIMKCSSIEVDCSAVSQTVDYVGMADAIEGHSFVLKVGNQRPLKLSIRSVLEKHVERLDYDRLRRAGTGGFVLCYINLGVTAPAQTFQDVVSAVESALLKFEFRH